MCRVNVVKLYINQQNDNVYIYIFICNASNQFYIQNIKIKHKAYCQKEIYVHKHFTNRKKHSACTIQLLKRKC